MISVVDVAVQAANPQAPLWPMRSFINSPSSIRVRNVPKKIGSWQITQVYFTAAYPDGSIKTAQCVLNGCVWVGTIEGSPISGTSENGYTIFANGIDEHGEPVNGYVLGKGDILIMQADGTITPDAPSYYVHLLSAQSDEPKEGDLWQNDGTYYIWQNGQAWPIGDDSGLIDELSAKIENKADLSALDEKADLSTLSEYLPLSGGTISGEVVWQASFYKGIKGRLLYSATEGIIRLENNDVSSGAYFTPTSFQGLSGNVVSWPTQPGRFATEGYVDSIVGDIETILNSL